MVSRVKITINIANGLLEEAKRTAREENRTLRDVVEEALQRQQHSQESRRPFQLRRQSFQGNGLQPGLTEGDWEKVRELIYGLG